MKVALVDVDSRIPNLALMKISQYHKSKAHDVSFYNPLIDNPDVIYASKIFDFTQGYYYYPNDTEIVKGGSGYNIKDVLPWYIENQAPDYLLYNKCNYAMGFTTRGCIRKCPFCIVPEKEGKIMAVADIYDFWSGQKEIMLFDNNLTALPGHFEKILKQLIKERVRVDFNQGLDIRLLTEDMAELLSKVRLWKQIHFAWDSMKDEQVVRRGIEILKRNMPLSRVMFYALIGYNTTPEEDLYRIEVLRGLKVDPFVMPFNKSDPYQKRFSRWVNHKAIFKSVKWADYK